MKIVMLAAVAFTLLAGCESVPSANGQQVAQEEERYVPTGSNIPRKKGQGTSVVSTMSKVELENMRADPGTAPPLPAGQ